MAFEIRTHPAFDRELEEQIAWLKEKTLWVAPRFADAVQKALELLSDRPNFGHPVWQEFRRYNLPGFSHALIYRIEGSTLYLIALMHERRHPDYWKHRLN